MEARDFNSAVPQGEFFERYEKGDLPWQIDRPQSEVLRLIEEGKFESPTSNEHRLLPGLPGYLIPFAPLAFVSQGQVSS